MADLAVVAANVKPYDNAVIERGVAGETVTAGQPVYQTYRRRWNGTPFADTLKVTRSVGSATGKAIGIALNNAGPKQPLSYQIGGDLDLGLDLDIGGVLIVSQNDGRISPIADLPTGHFLCKLGAPTEDRRLRIQIDFTAGQKE